MSMIDTFFTKALELQALVEARAASWSSDDEWAQNAALLLEETLGSLRVTPTEILERAMFRQGPRPTFASLDFSHHPLTLWSSEEASLDVYFWYPGETAPHDHGFHGAFMPIFGEYAEACVSFSPSVDLGEGLWIGDLATGPEVQCPLGVARPILHAPAFIHQVNHHSFCVTLCLRSRFGGVPLSDYFASGIKLQNDRVLTTRALEDWQRLVLLDDLAPAVVPQYLTRASLGTLARWWLKIMESGTRRSLREKVRLEVLGREHGARILE